MPQGAKERKTKMITEKERRRIIRRYELAEVRLYTLDMLQAKDLLSILEVEQLSRQEPDHLEKVAEQMEALASLSIY